MEPTEIIELTSAEVNALTKAIMYLKFTCDDTDSLLYAGSPLINSTFDKLINMHGAKPHWDHIFKKLPNMHEEFIQKKIKNSEVEDKTTMAADARKKLFEACIYPYRSE